MTVHNEGIVNSGSGTIVVNNCVVGTGAKLVVSGDKADTNKK